MKLSKFRPEDLLDAVLSDMLRWQQENEGKQTFENIKESTDTESQDDIRNLLYSDRLASIIHQLYIDGYINYDNKEANFDLREYYVTFRGEWFITEEKGYRKRIDNKADENIRVVTLEQNQRDNANRMTYLTTVLTLSSLVSCIYYVLEIHSKHRSFYLKLLNFWPFVLVFLFLVGTSITLLLLQRRYRTKRQLDNIRKSYRRLG